MLLGHYGVALAAKKAEPSISLGTFFLATMFLDLLCFTFLFLGIERVQFEPGYTQVIPLHFTHYPFSHSLAAASLWSIVFVTLYKKFNPHSRGTAWLAIVIASHWILDLASHSQDLVLYPGSQLYLGFGLWNSLTATLLVEGLLFGMGVGLYLNATRAEDKIGLWGFWALVIVLIVLYGVMVFALQPPDKNLFLFAQGGLILSVIWAHWVDHHRKVRFAS